MGAIDNVAINISLCIDTRIPVVFAFLALLQIDKFIQSCYVKFTGSVTFMLSEDLSNSLVSLLPYQQLPHRLQTASNNLSYSQVPTPKSPHKLIAILHAFFPQQNPGQWEYVVGSTSFFFPLTQWK